MLNSHLPNRFGHSQSENLILFIAIDLGPLASDSALLIIGGAFCPGLLRLELRSMLDQQ